jgi:hypothetical protein
VGTNETLLLQSYELAEQQMAEARKSIDKVFGSNYALRNPALVGAFMQTAAINFAVMTHQLLQTHRSN